MRHHPAKQDEDHGRVKVTFSQDTARRARRAALVFIALLFVGLVVVGALRWRHSAALAEQARAESGRAPEVVVSKVGQSGVGQGVALPGEASAWSESTIYSRVNGYVGSWRGDIGMRVHKGEVLATLETPELDAQLDAARANGVSAQAQVRLRDAESEFARTTWERWRDSPRGVVSEQEREAKKAEFDGAQARLSVARAQLAIDEAQLRNIEAQVQYRNVTAPFDGTVVERKLDIGNLVTAGSTSSTTLLYRMVQDDRIRIFVEVPQAIAAEIMRARPKARITSTALPGRVFEGGIARTAQALSAQARTLRVEVDLANPARELVPGMFVDVRFELGAPGAPQVPAASLVFRPAGPQVAVVDAQNHVHFRDVSIVRDRGNLVDVGKGVEAGERVVMNISSQIPDGGLVSPREMEVK